MFTLQLQRRHVDEIIEHAQRLLPSECCGLVGGDACGQARSIYPLENTAARPLFEYEAAPEELFAAQRSMRERGEQLLAIYHSHPAAAEPVPSATDVRLAFYPEAAYLIIGLGGASPRLAAFVISEAEQRWKQVEYAICDE